MPGHAVLLLVIVIGWVAWTAWRIITAPGWQDSE